MDDVWPIAHLESIPRKGSEPVFETPWEARAFAAVVALVERGHFQWEAFRDHLIAEIAAQEGDATSLEAGGQAYYKCWLAAAEKLLGDHRLVRSAEIETLMTQLDPERSARTD